VILSAHRIHLELPPGWSGRTFSREGLARVQAGDFPLALTDGEFGDQSTGRMPHAGTFLALAEYRAGAGLEPGRGLFASRKIPLPLDPSGFSATGLAHPRPGQAGMQHFFTHAGRPFCLYVVVAGGRSIRRGQLLVADRVLRSLRIGSGPPAARPD
jgi:hypothetical protein